MLETILSLFLSWAAPQVCDSTIFGYTGDGYGGRTPTVLTGEPVKDYDFGIAHRTLPMGSVIKVQNLRTREVAVGVVLDRGPYGMIDARGWFNSAREKERARAYIAEVGKRKAYRGCADITPALAQAISHRGRDRVRIWRGRARDRDTSRLLAKALRSAREVAWRLEQLGDRYGEATRLASLQD